MACFIEACERFNLANWDSNFEAREAKKPLLHAVRGTLAVCEKGSSSQGSTVEAGCKDAEA